MNLKEMLSRLRGQPDGTVKFESALSAKVIRGDGRVENLGVIARRVVTTAFVNLLVDCLHADAPSIALLQLFKYHAAGTGVGGEVIGDTALGTEVGTRVAGTQAEGATPNIYQSVGTWAFDTTRAITEHGLLTQLAAGGTLLDRSVFSAINGVSGDSIQFTYSLTCTAGG
jgi:hypothetical protein